MPKSTGGDFNGPACWKVPNQCLEGYNDIIILMNLNYTVQLNDLPCFKWHYKAAIPTVNENKDVGFEYILRYTSGSCEHDAGVNRCLVNSQRDCKTSFNLTRYEDHAHLYASITYSDPLGDQLVWEANMASTLYQDDFRVFKGISSC